MEGRLVYFRPRTVLVVLAVVLAAALVLRVLWVTRDVLIWAAIALFLAMALNPAVEWLQTRGIRRRGLAVAIVFVGTVLGIVAVGALFVPTLVREVNDFAQAVPDYVDDLTKGRGRLGFLERDYQIVEKVREAIEKSGAAGVLGLSSTAVAVTKSVINAVVAVLKTVRLNVRIAAEAFKVFTFVPRMLAAAAAKILSYFIRPILNGLGWIIRGSARAFGWLPIIGPKLKNAARSFEQF
jgi:predicted PurR-regulated permease PerM